MAPKLLWGAVMEIAMLVLMAAGCPAEQQPEWAQASAVEKRDLLRRCPRVERPPPSTIAPAPKVEPMTLVEPAPPRAPAPPPVAEVAIELEVSFLYGPTRGGYGLPATLFVAQTYASVETPGIGAALDLSWYARPWLRVVVDAGGRLGGLGYLQGRALLGADAVLPLEWGELFAGASAGALYSTFGQASIGLFGRSSPLWTWGGALRVRAGVDLMLLRPFSVGLSASYDAAFGSMNPFVSAPDQLVLHGAAFTLRTGVVF